MVLLITINFFLAKWMDSRAGHAKLWLILAVVINLGVLFFYKYLNFFSANLNMVLKVIKLPAINIPVIALPIGISFYVFQILSYVIDAYYKRVPVQQKISRLMLYVSLFPQLIAGPIVRYETICADIEKRETNWDNIYNGYIRFVFGFAKKVFIADSMAKVADTVFNSPVSQIPQSFAWIGVVAYSLQIYYDFSGYSDMAIGFGLVFNFKFLENFNYPYISKSIQEFWRRWHISLSTWLKDYLYVPLGGNQKGPLRTYVNLWIVFLLCGLWHGASWTYVIFGAYHGFALVIERAGFDKILKKIPVFFAHLYVGLFLLIGWVIFRSSDFSYALSFLKIMFAGNPGHSFFSFHQALDFISYFNLEIFVLGLVLSTPYVAKAFSKLGEKTRGVFVCILFLITLAFAVTSNYSPFIYFRF